MLIEAGLIDQEKLDEALEEQKKSGQKIGSILIKKGYLSIDDFNKVLHQQTGLDTINLNNVNIQRELLTLFPVGLCLKYQFFPISRSEDLIKVAMTDPSDMTAIEEIQFISGLKVKTIIAPEITIMEAIEKHIKASSEDKASQFLEEIEMVDDSSVELNQEDAIESDLNGAAPLIKLVNLVIYDAISHGASHIHFEPYEKSFNIRLRIDGILHEYMAPPQNMRNGILSRIKIIAGIDISEKRIPQDGQIIIKLKIEGKIKPINLKVVTLPTSHGERVVIHILDKERELRDINHLGFLPEDLKILEKSLNSHSGMILITGPRDSGKTTTIYSILDFLKKQNLCILTAENPIKHTLEGISQSLIKSDIGLSYTAILRTMQQQDPDVLMIQEIPDKEVAQLAARTALDGYLVLSTMYAPDTATALIKLDELGLNPTLILSAVRVILTQRLIRKICKKCKFDYALSKNQINTIMPFLSVDNSKKKISSDSFKLFSGKGCDICKGSGYQGRLLVSEILEPSEKIHDALIKDSSQENIRKVIQKSGITTLAHKTLSLAKQGWTSFDEFMRILHDTTME